MRQSARLLSQLDWLSIVCSIYSLAMHEESSTRRKVDDKVHDGAIPAYLLDRDTTTRAKVKSCYIFCRCLLFHCSSSAWTQFFDTSCFWFIQVLSNTIKQKRKEKAGKWEVPLPKVRMPWLISFTPPSINFAIFLRSLLNCSCTLLQLLWNKRFPMLGYSANTSITYNLSIGCKVSSCFMPFYSLMWSDGISNITDFLALQVRPVAEDEMFRVIRSGKRKSKSLPPFLSVPNLKYIWMFWALNLLKWSSKLLNYVRIIEN